jgi:hypothetical protein
MKKSRELFFFFKIKDVYKFKKAFKSNIIPLVTSTSKLLGDVSSQPLAMLNVAFSSTGLHTLNVTDDLGDALFTNGQFADAANLKDDNPQSNWVSGFRGTDVHGVFLIASDSDLRIAAKLLQITIALGGAIQELYRISGAARPGKEAGHERM